MTIRKLKYAHVLASLTLAFTFFFVMLISIQFYYSSSRYFNKNFNEYAQHQLNSATQYVNDYFSKVKWVAEQIGNDEANVNFVYNYNNMELSQKRNLVNGTIPTVLSRSKMVDQNISSIIFFGPVSCIQLGRTAVVNKTMYDLEENLNFIPTETTLVEPMLSNPASYSSFDDLRNQFFFVKPLVKNNKSIGYLCLVIEDGIKASLLSAYPESILCSSNGEILINNTSYAYSKTIVTNTHNTLSITKTTDFNKISVTYINNPNKLKIKITSLIVCIILFGLFTMFFTFIFAFLNSKRITKPLLELNTEITAYDMHPPNNNEYTQPKIKGLSMREHIMYYMLITITVPCLLFTLFTNIYFSYTITLFVENSLQISNEQTYQRVQELMTNISETSDFFSFYGPIQKSILFENPKTDKALKLLNYCTSFYSYNVDISLHNLDGTIYATTEKTESAVELDQTQIRQWHFTKKPRNEFVLSYAVQLISLDDFTPIGYLRCSIDNVNLNQCYYDTINPNNIIFISNANGIIVSSSNKGLIGEGTDAGFNFLSDNTSSQQLLDPININGSIFSLSSVYNKKNLVNFERDTFIASSTYIIIIIFLVALILSLFFSHTIAISMKKLYKNMTDTNILDVDTDNNNHIFERSMIYEIDQLRSAFADMKVRISNLLAEMTAASEQRLSLEKSKRESEMALLQSQINPHFLYNTFESINFMIKSKCEDKATLMIQSLSNMLRFTSKSESLIVSLDQEIKYAKQYVEIMKIRYTDNLSVIFNVENTHMKLKSMKFILQPIIENAIYHGIGSNGGCGNIAITVNVVDFKLIIMVRDDGIGINSNELLNLQQSLKYCTPCEKIGLTNINNRIKTYFGNEYGIIIHSTLGSGTIVSIIQPVL